MVKSEGVRGGGGGVRVCGVRGGLRLGSFYNLRVITLTILLHST